jgi:hypothetical protein
VRFRKKPVVIEAVQLDGTPEGCRRVHDFLGWEHNDAGNCPGPITIDTLEGDMWCEIGSWVIKGVQGEFYPCKPDIFAATYEPVTEPAPPPTTVEPTAHASEDEAESKFDAHIQAAKNLAELCRGYGPGVYPTKFGGAGWEITVAPVADPVEVDAPGVGSCAGTGRAR